MEGKWFPSTPHPGGAGLELELLQNPQPPVVSSLQEGSGCLEHVWQELPYVLAWYVPWGPLRPQQGCGTVPALLAWEGVGQERMGWDGMGWNGCAHLSSASPARLVPVLMLLGQLIAHGMSLTDIAPRHLEPIVPWRGNGSRETYSLYCSRYAAE